LKFNYIWKIYEKKTKESQFYGTWHGGVDNYDNASKSF